MNERLKELSDKCTERQARFVENLYQTADRGQSYIDAGFKPKNKEVAAQCAWRLLNKNANVKTYYEALWEEKARTSNISRTQQLRKLDRAYEIAEQGNNPSAMVAATREQNEMLGYHRETAPNPEKELLRQARLTAEERELAREVARIRTRQEALKPPRRPVMSRILPEGTENG